MGSFGQLVICIAAVLSAGGGALVLAGSSKPRVLEAGQKLLHAAAVAGVFAGATLGHGNAAQAASDAGVLPAEVFAVGNNVNGLGATYRIQEVRGPWIRVVSFRSLDEHNAPPQVSRWICVPAINGAWSKAG